MSEWLKEHGFEDADGIWSRGYLRVYSYTHGWQAVHIESFYAAGRGDTPHEALAALAISLGKVTERLRDSLAELEAETESLRQELAR